MPTTSTFPIDLGAFKPVALDPTQRQLTDSQRKQLQANIDLCRDAIVFFTATGAAKGLGGHTGGPYDIVPEVLIADGFMRGSDQIVPILFDEAGHRVAIQYLMSALYEHIPPERLLHYREAHSLLPGHPELGLTPGVAFSSGRLGHMWPYCNGVALANPDKVVFCFGSDGSQQEGNDAEAARLAVANRINVKLVIDDNDVTIAGHPSAYMRGFNVAETLEGHGLTVTTGDGENLDELYRRMVTAINTEGPVALVNKRLMAVGIDGLEGLPEAHDVVPVGVAIDHLTKRGHEEAAEFLKRIEKPKNPATYRGSSDEVDSNRQVFGTTVADILGRMSEDQRKAKVFVIDSDLEGSTGLKAIREAYPEVYVTSGPMERGNFSAAAGFGMQGADERRQGVMATFSAFLEMCISEITMARLNLSNVLCHFSHAGVDDMADNTCHFGLNNFFADNGLEELDDTRLYFPADAHQMRTCVETVFEQTGLRFIFSTRSKVPYIHDDSGKPMFDPDLGYTFEPGRDELVRDGDAGFIVSYGDMLYRALDAVEQLRDDGVNVALVNKPTLNVVDEDMMRRLGNAPFVLVVESLNRKTALGVRFGTWLLERGYCPRYAHLGTVREGSGGLWEQIPHQGLDPQPIADKARELAAKSA